MSAFRNAMLDTLKGAMQRLVGLQAGKTSVSDGVGFNNADLPIAAAIVDMWDIVTADNRSVAFVGHLLLKYKNTQLDEGEVRVAEEAIKLDVTSYDDLRHGMRGQVEVAIQKRKDEALKTVYVDASEGLPSISFTYNKGVVAAVKESFQFRRYDGELKCWRLTSRPTINEWNDFKKRCHDLGFRVLLAGGSVKHTEQHKPWPINASADLKKMTLKVWFDKGIPYFQDIVRACKVSDGRYKWDSGYWVIRDEKCMVFAEIVSGEGKWDVEMVQKEAAKIHNLALSKLSKIKSSELAPILVPTGITLFEHQGKGIRFLMARDQALLADDMGLGKTLQALLACEQIEKCKKVLILCPASLTHNWASEISKWMPGCESSVLTSSSASVGAKYCIASYDTAKRKGKVMDAVLSQTWDVLVCDEAHRMKNPKSKRHIIGRSIKAKRKWLLTGTPMLNRPMDLLGLLRIAKNPMASNRHKFGVMYCAGFHNGWGWDYSGSSNLDDLAQKLSNWMLRRHKDEVLDLPGKSRLRVPVDASMAFDGDPGDIGNMMKMRHDMAVEKARYTVDRARDIVDAGHKVVIFSEYIGVLDEIEMSMQKDGVKSVRIDGSKDQKARQGAVVSFQNDPSVKVFIGQTVAAGEGLTLTSASYVIFNDLSLVPAMHSQAEDRCYRIGQDQRVTVYYHVANRKLDYILWNLLESKMETISNFEKGLTPPAVALQELLERLRCPL